MLNYVKAYMVYPILESYLKRDISTKKKFLDQFSLVPKDERKVIVHKSLINTLENAKQNVPYYRDLFKRIKFDLNKVEKDIRYLQDVPFLTKDIIREQKNRLLSEKLVNGIKIPRKTGGSTGVSVNIYYDQEALDWTAAANLHAIEFTGRKHHNLEVHLSTDFQNQIPFKARLTEYIKCMGMNRVNILTHSLRDDELSKVLQKLDKVRPYIVQGHPSTLYALALYVKKHGIQRNNFFKAFESTGETLDLKKIKLIEEQIGAKTYNRYGSAEFGVVAHSEGDPLLLKVISPIAYVENYTLDETLNELVITNLTNKLMPLIRYRTGDIGKLIEMNDETYIMNLEGRIHDIITINNNHYPTHYVQDVLDKIGGIDEFQIIEHQNGSYTLKVVPQNNLLKIESIKAEMTKIFGDNFKVEISTLHQLAKSGWREKFRYLVKE